MQKINNFLKLMRIKHYVKNVLILIPLFFSKNLFNQTALLQIAIAFFSFSLLASAIYIINDIKDVEKDRLHKTKKYRPLASGAIKIKEGFTLAILLIIISIGLAHWSYGLGMPCVVLISYLIINLLYSVGGLKNMPILDVTILSLGFILRVIYGASAINVDISKWLYLTIFAFSFFMGLGKRRNELTKNGFTTRLVNRYYNKDFLDKNMYVCLALCVVFYALWTIDPIQQKNELLLWTVPLVMIILMRYSLVIESGDSDADPVGVLLNSKSLIVLVTIYALAMFGLVYL